MNLTIDHIKIMLADELIAKRVNEQKVAELEAKVKELESRLEAGQKQDADNK